jgi:hypothetical protein
MTKDEILEKVKDKTKNYKVNFTKADGSNREMKFTRDEDLMGDMNLTPKGTGHATSDEALKVIELCDDGKTQWRSFRYDSVISLEESSEK